MSIRLVQARERMSSGFGLLAIDDHTDDVVVKKQSPPPAEVIATELTGELSPSGSACEGDEEEEGAGGGALTRTLSALHRLSVEEQTTLRRKLGSQQQQQSSRENTTSSSSSGSVAKDHNSTKEQQETSSHSSSKAEKGEGIAVGAPAADSPFRVVLQKAVVESDLEAATAALVSGADPNERDELCHSSLHFAAAKGDIGCLRELMQSGARANVANNVGWSPLHYAVLGGHVAVVEALLRAGAYPCFRDNHLISPLHLASTQPGEKETFRRIAELLGPPALLARDELQQTPLHVAASCGNRGAVSVLLDLNADPEATDRKGRVAGQSFLRQVTRRAKADIRASLAAAVERINAPPSPLLPESDGGDGGDFADETVGGGGGGGLPPRTGMKRATSTASCESAEPVRRPSMLSLMGWGGGKEEFAGNNSSKAAAATGRGEASFGAFGRRVQVLSPRSAAGVGPAGIASC